MDPDFTIVTANLNGAKYLQDCLESVTQQEGATFEHLVIDGESTDGSQEIVRQYPDVILHEENDSGISHAINRGFKMARGRWVMWLNGDDRLKPGALATVLKFLEGEKDVDVVYGGWDFVDADGNFKKRQWVFPFRRVMLAHLGCYIGSTACFLRRESTVAEGFLLDEDFHVVMDGEYYCRLARGGKRFQYLPGILAEFRLHGQNASFRQYGQKGMKSQLALQKQWAESAAIRRVYGVTIFRGGHPSAVVDAIFYGFFLLQKAFLKRLYRLVGLISCRTRKRD